jgi:hypothetical protein
MHVANIGAAGEWVREPGGWLKLPRTLILPLLAAALIATAIAATFVVGEKRGMDHVAAFGPASDQRSIAVALSDVVYKLNLGYIGYNSVLDALTGVWNKGATNGNDSILITNDSDRELLNSAIHAAASLGPQHPGYISDQSLFTMYYDDLGYVDYVEWAFRLFGLKYEAMYYLFFTLLALSSLAFLITFRSNPMALAVLLANVFAFLIEVYVGNFAPAIPTFAGMRHGSTLGLLPMWHFVFLTMSRTRPSIANVALSLFQLMVLILAIKMRGSASWMVLFVVAVALFRALWPWLRSSRATRSWAQLARSLAQWPAIVLLSGLFANSLYMNATLHPVYFTDDAVPHHTLWHSIYLGWVEQSPDLASPYVRDMIAKGANADMVGYYAALEYLRETHTMPSDPTTLQASSPAFLSELYRGAIKYGFYDKIMRRIVIGIIRKHPAKVIKIIAIDNPIAAFNTVMSIFKNAPGHVWEVLIILGGLAMAATAAPEVRFPRADVDANHVGNTLLLVGTSVPFAATINLITYAAPHTVSDLLLSLLIFFQIAIWAAAILVGIGLRQLLARAGISNISAHDMARAIGRKDE